MRRALATLALMCLAGCGGAPANPDRQPASAPGTASPSPSPAAPAKFSVTSPAFADNTPIPVEYSCKGRNVPPTLRWANVPPGTESLALVVDDPDAVSGLYVHWVVTDIPPATTEIVGGALPAGAVVGRNSGGQTQYMGPCPPAGTGVHHYRFQLYALREPLNLAPTTPAAQAAQTIANAAADTAVTVGLFSG
ncbi:YbhB/YbcL family Raf kinase inhibitor-like protein [Mycobacterium sp.]|uniref:YbhB/YbcL family Raf kinase inhibitor-like protein n=1 Tax=Mycobacterium sp. TaxID=1785 RepID=UPI001282AAC0|nr:YbhB/YbcL family Raf kinase inhibitor-like protein [Mycobacterium sp.]KAA8967407.1 MAG: YbhB/YbcL family Raf kinase inhibitor-like protein [Mycobacterium sp.]